MTDNTNAPEKEEPKLEELIQFPAKLTFKFIGNNNDAVEGIIKTFFDEKLAIGAQISEGRKSRTGKYDHVRIGMYTDAGRKRGDTSDGQRYGAWYPDCC